MEFWEQIDSLEKNTLFKEIRTPGGSVLQKRMVGSEKGCE